MRLFVQNFFAFVLLFCAASQASATTYRYDLTFKDYGGAVIGNGVLAYDTSVTEDLYQDYTGERCYDPTRFGCSYFDSWTPLTEFSAEIAGRDVFEISYTDLWLEGTYAYHGRYQVGGFESQTWRVGDIYFAQSMFTMAPPPAGVDQYETSFSFEPDYGNQSISGTVHMTHVVPGPPALASLGLGVLVLLGWRRFMSR